MVFCKLLGIDQSSKSIGFVAEKIGPSLGISKRADKNLKKALKAVCRDTKTDRSNMKTILFSPAAASFDSFKNFEDRGFYFNKIIKKYFNDK